MSRSSKLPPQRAARRAGVSLITATLLFAAVFAWLAARFGYPDVLGQPAADVLPRLLALGTPGRAVWLLYALVPLLLVPAALGVRALGREAAPAAGRLALLLAVLAALSMTAGLVRWPSLNWHLALAHADASPEGRAAIAATVDAANLWLGTVLGEFLGELFLNAFWATAAWVVAQASPRLGRWLLPAGLAAAGIGTVAMLRNVLPAVGPVAELNNLVLPLWMLVLGVALLRYPSSGITRAGGPLPAASPVGNS